MIEVYILIDSAEYPKELRKDSIQRSFVGNHIGLVCRDAQEFLPATTAG